MTAESVPAEGAHPAEAHPEFLDAADIAQLKSHCPELLAAVTALEETASTIQHNAALDSAAAIAIGKGLELVRRKLESATAQSTRLMSEQLEPRCSSSGGCERDLRSEKTPGIEVGNDTHPDPEVFHDTP